MKRRSKKIAIEQAPSEKLDKIELVLAMLYIIALVVLVLFPHANISYGVGLYILGGLFVFYRGIKKIVEARKRQQRILWYKEPGILFGLGALFGALPWFLLDNFLSDTVPNASNIKHIAEVVSIGVTLIFLLPAIYFYYKGKLQSHQGSKRIGQLVLLGQSRRSDPQPKEVRENEGDPMGLEHG
jgi:hypothetical protein